MGNRKSNFSCSFDS